MIKTENCNFLNHTIVLNNMEKLSRKSKYNILFRVWLSFFLSIIFNRAVAPGIGFGVGLMMFKELVFVEAVIKNVLSVELGKVPNYLWQALLYTDTATILSLACMIMSIWLLVIYLRGLRGGRYRQSIA